jgi:hypothetical protein
LHYERYDAIDHLVTGGFYVGGVQDYSHQSIQDIPTFCSSLTSLETRKQRLSLNRLSLQADMLKDRSKIAGVSFDDLMQADFVLFMRDAVDSFKRDQHNRWAPETLIYAQHRTTPFEMFARARSKRYFDKIKPAIGVEDKPELASVGQAFGTKLYLPRWRYFSLPSGELMGFDQLATTT